MPEYLNNCQHCPILGRTSDEIRDEEFFTTRNFLVSIVCARKLARPEMIRTVPDVFIQHALACKGSTFYPAHLDHLPPDLPPGLAIEIPPEYGQGIMLLDGHHRAARSLRDHAQFNVYLLPASETQELIRLTDERIGQLNLRHTISLYRFKSANCFVEKLEPLTGGSINETTPELAKTTPTNPNQPKRTNTND